MTDRLKYNPALMSEQALIDNFVVREADLRIILRVIAENDGSANQHVLVIGPRGSGKTSLLLRVAAAVRRDPELGKQWFPVHFPEESYFVSSPGEFWLEALLHIADQTDSERWHHTYEDLRDERDESRLRERALAQLADFAQEGGGRLLLLVENLNMLLGEQLSNEDAWAIRHTLINEPHIMLLGSATSRFDAIDKGDKAMFDLFRVLSLPPLSPGECDMVWENIAGRPLGEEKIRAIRILTGGNLRLLTIAAEFGAHRSFRDLMENLIRLIDDNTEYFKSHLDGMAPVERKVYLALADLWEEAEARDVAKVARINVNTASALLQRLVQRGAVTIRETGKRSRRYAVAERMYNIYHLIRRRGKSEERVRVVVRFMLALYGPEEAARHLMREARDLAPEHCGDYLQALPEVIKGIAEPERLMELFAEAPEHFRGLFAKTSATSPAGRDTAMSPEDEWSSEWEKARAILAQAFQLDQQGEHEQAIAGYDVFLRCYEGSADPLIRENLSSALFNKGVGLGGLGKIEEELAAYDDLIARFGRGRESEYVESMLAGALYNRALALGSLGRTEEQLNAYDSLLHRFGESSHPDIAVQAAKALLNKGVALGKLGRTHEELEIYDQVMARYGESPEPALMERVIKALWNKGIVFYELSRFQEELETYEELVARYGESSEPVLMEWTAKALHSMGVTLGRLGRVEDELSVYDGLINRYQACPDPVLMERVAKTFWNKAIVLAEQNRAEQALATYNSLLDRYGAIPEPVFMRISANALINKGVSLGRLGRPEEELEAYETLLARYADSPESFLQKQIASALYCQALTFDELGRREESKKAYRLLFDRYGGSSEPDIAEMAARGVSILLSAMENRDPGKENLFQEALQRNPASVLLWAHYFRFLLEENRSQEALNLGAKLLADNAADANLHNQMAWRIYIAETPSLYVQAEQWAHQAVALKPDNPAYRHTLACLLCANGKGAESIPHAAAYLGDQALVRRGIEDAIELFTRMAAAGLASEALELIEESGVAADLEPLLVALRMHLGRTVTAAQEIREIARDVIRRIEERKSPA